MEFRIDINSDDFVKMANKLEKVHKSALPVAIRQTVNDVAFNARLEANDIFNKQFINRTKGSFIKSHNVVNKSKNTLNIREIEAEVGIKKGKSNSGDFLHKHELGGSVKGKDVPMDAARINSDRVRRIRRQHYKAIWGKAEKGIVSRTPSKTIIKTDKYLFSVSRKKKGKDSGEWKTLYAFDQSFNLRKRPFLVKGGKKAMKGAPDIFYKHAVNRINKYMK